MDPSNNPQRTSYDSVRRWRLWAWGFFCWPSRGWR